MRAGGNEHSSWRKKQVKCDDYTEFKIQELLNHTWYILYARVFFYLTVELSVSLPTSDKYQRSICFLQILPRGNWWDVWYLTWLCRWSQACTKTDPPWGWQETHCPPQSGTGKLWIDKHFNTFKLFMLLRPANVSKLQTDCRWTFVIVILYTWEINRAGNEPSQSLKFHNHMLKVATTTFTFMVLLRHYAKQALMVCRHHMRIC